MSDKHRARKKKPVEPVDWEELERAPNLGGMLSFLNVPPEEAQRRHAAAEQLAPLEERAAAMTGVLDAPPVSDTAGVLNTELPVAPPEPIFNTPPASNTGASHTPPASETRIYNTPPVSDTPASEVAGPGAAPAVAAPGRPAPLSPGVPSLAAPAFNAPPVLDTQSVWNTPPVPIPRPFLPAGNVRTTSEQIAKRFRPLDGARVARCVLAQDAHTLAEQVLYTALYNTGEGVAPHRDVAVGNRWLMARTGLSERAVQLNLKSLEMKLSIETLRRHNPDTNEPKTYRVYSYDRILERRRAAGLEWIQTKRGGGVRLISADEAAAYHTPPVLDRPAAFLAGPVSEAARGGVSDTRQPPVSQTSYLGKGIGKDFRQTSPSELAVVVEALLRSAGTADDDAASRLLAACRDRAHDATAAEVVHWIEQSAARLARMRNVGNPVGLLLAMVPKCFEGESFRQYREAQQRGREAEAAAEAEYRREYERILEDPDAGEEEKRLAREILDATGGAA